MKKDVAINCENTFPDADRPSKTRDLTYVALGVAVVTVCAWISIPVGDVPFTLQTLAVAAIGGILGWKKGLLTILIYILLGLIGVPVFAGFKSGVPALMGATGGYIFGFAFAVVISGLAKLIPVKNKFARIGVFFAANILGLTICYVFGTAWFITVYGKNVGSIGVKSALMLCVVPKKRPVAETFYRGGIIRPPRNLHEIKSGRNIVRFLLFLNKFFDFQPQFIFVAKPCDFFHHFRLMMVVDCPLVRPFIDKKNRFFVLLRKEVFVSEITLFVSHLARNTRRFHFVYKLSRRPVFARIIQIHNNHNSPIDSARLRLICIYNIITKNGKTQPLIYA